MCLMRLRFVPFWVILGHSRGIERQGVTFIELEWQRACGLLNLPGDGLESGRGDNTDQISQMGAAASAAEQ